MKWNNIILVTLLFIFSIAINNDANALTTLNFEEFSGMQYQSGTAISDTFKLSTQYLNTYGINFYSSSSFVAVVQLGE